MKRSNNQISAKPEPSAFNAFWNVSPTPFEWLLLALVVAMATGLHLTPVLASGWGKLLLTGLAAVCFLSPMTGFFFIAACSILPYPDLAANEIARTEGLNSALAATTNPAQFGVYLWPIITVIRYQRFALSGLWRLWPMLPWLAWYALVTGTNILNPNTDYVKGCIFAVMACQLANEAKGQYLKCLLGLCLGALVALIAFWAWSLGLPVEISHYGTLREGIERMGSTRADAVMLWPPILMGIAGLSGLALVLMTRFNPRPLSKYFVVTMIGLVVLAIPPLMSTMSHGAYAGLGLTAAAVASAYLALHWAGIILPRHAGSLIAVSLLAGAVILGMFAFDALHIRTKAHALSVEYKDTSMEHGMAASRTGVWQDSINTILDKPLLGLNGHLEDEKITSEYEAQGGYASHNVFFDYGRASGIPGMLLLMFFFFYPSIKACQATNWPLFVPFMLFHFALLIFWMSLSFWGYKTFWGFWMLMTMAVSMAESAAARRNPEPDPKRKASVSDPVLSPSRGAAQPWNANHPIGPARGIT